MERKGAAYSIKSKRPAQDPNAHAQVTQASAWSGSAPGWPKKGGGMMTPDEEFEEEQRWEAQRDIDRFGV